MFVSSNVSATEASFVNPGSAPYKAAFASRATHVSGGARLGLVRAPTPAGAFGRAATVACLTAGGVANGEAA